MSTSDDNAPASSAASQSINEILRADAKDLGGFTVSRVLPGAERMTVGPFIFFDEMGPAQFPPGEGMMVRPHPHIGLATVTFLFAGTIIHRDSLEYELPIEPGAVNLMTAGRGIVHSERTPPDLLASGQFLHGIQTWMALPDGLEDMEPAFVHYPADALPLHEDNGVRTTVIIGQAYGLTSPVAVHAATLYLEQRIPAGATATVPQTAIERGAYIVAGIVKIDEQELGPGQLAVLGDGDIQLHAAVDSHIMIIGGEPIGERNLKWNFVHSSAERIRRAGQDWVDGKFTSIDGDPEFIPLPENFFD